MNTTGHEIYAFVNGKLVGEHAALKLGHQYACNFFCTLSCHRSAGSANVRLQIKSNNLFGRAKPLGQRSVRLPAPVSGEAPLREELRFSPQRHRRPQGTYPKSLSTISLREESYRCYSCDENRTTDLCLSLCRRASSEDRLSLWGRTAPPLILPTALGLTRYSP